MPDQNLIVVVPKMMPGQDPYTPEEYARVRQLVADAAAANVTELDEIEAPATRREVDDRPGADFQCRDTELHALGCPCGAGGDAELICTKCEIRIPAPAYGDPNHQLCEGCYEDLGQRQWEDRFL